MLPATRASVPSSSNPLFKLSPAPGGADDYVGAALADALMMELGTTVKMVSSRARVWGASEWCSWLIRSQPDESSAPISCGWRDSAAGRPPPGRGGPVAGGRRGDGLERPVRRDVDRLFRVQDTIAEQVTRALAVRLSGEQRQALARRRARNTEAYEAYLKGRYFWNMRTADGSPGARLFPAGDRQGSRMRRPMPAWPIPTRCSARCRMRSCRPRTRARKPKRRPAALALDETLAEAHVSLAFVTYAFDWDWPQGEREFKRAIELDPTTRRPTSGTRCISGSSVASTKPSRPRSARTSSSRCRWSAHTWWACRIILRGASTPRPIRAEALEINPKFPSGRRLLGQVFVAERRYDEAASRCSA